MNDEQRKRIARIRRFANEQMALKQSRKSNIWKEGSRYLRYMVNMHDDDLEMLRYHAAQFAGESPMAYWYQPGGTAPHLQQPYDRYTRDVPAKYHIGEPELDGLTFQHGSPHQGKLINFDIVRYQSAISNLATLGILDNLENLGRRRVICEIGSGYGGFAYQLTSLIGESTYILADLPESLFVAGAFLVLYRPEAKICLWDEGIVPVSPDDHDSEEFDFILVPENKIHEFTTLNLDLFFSMWALQEMSDEVIDEYISWASRHCRGFLYSDNWSKHPFNEFLMGTVEEVLQRHFFLFPDPSIYQNPVLNEAYQNENYGPTKVFAGVSRIQNTNCEIFGHIKVDSARYKISGQRGEKTLVEPNADEE